MQATNTRPPLFAAPNIQPNIQPSIQTDTCLFASWRPQPHSRTSLERLMAEQEKEERILRRIFAESTHADTPLAALFELTLELCPHGATDKAALAKKLAEEALAWRFSFDAEGNPLWISLPPSRKDEERNEPESVLPSPAESALPTGTLFPDDKTGKENKEIPKRDNPLFNGLDTLVRHFTGTPRQEAALPVSPYAGRGTLPPPKSRFFPNLIRMLFVGACLAVIYHALSLKGWAPRLF